MSKQDEFYEAKAEFVERQDAKDIADEIMRMFGVGPGSSSDFPGLDEARKEYTRTLDEWTREEMEKKNG